MFGKRKEAQPKDVREALPRHPSVTVFALMPGGILGGAGLDLVRIRTAEDR